MSCFHKRQAPWRQGLLRETTQYDRKSTGLDVSVFESPLKLHHLLAVLSWTRQLIEKVIKSASWGALRINWDNACGAPGIVFGTWQDSLTERVCGASAEPFHSGCRVGTCGLKIHQSGCSDTFCLLFWLECGQKFQCQGFKETMPSLHFQDHTGLPTPHWALKASPEPSPRGPARFLLPHPLGLYGVSKASSQSWPQTQGLFLGSLYLLIADSLLGEK